MRALFRLPYADIRLNSRWVVGFDMGLWVVGINFYRHGWVAAVPFFFVEYIRD